jgi:hypothetical protein
MERAFRRGVCALWGGIWGYGAPRKGFALEGSDVLVQAPVTQIPKVRGPGMDCCV